MPAPDSKVSPVVVARVSDAASPLPNAGFQGPAAPLPDPDLGILSSLKADSGNGLVSARAFGGTLSAAQGTCLFQAFSINTTRLAFHL